MNLHLTNLFLSIPEVELPVCLSLSLNVLITNDLLMKSKVLAFVGRGSAVCRLYPKEQVWKVPMQ